MAHVLADNTERDNFMGYTKTPGGDHDALFLVMGSTVWSSVNGLNTNFD